MIYKNSEKIPDKKYEIPSIVYACKHNGNVKIGVTKTPKRRIIQLECSCGEFFNKIYVSKPREDARQQEKVLHAYFQKCRGVGEWFNAPFESVVDAIDNYERTNSLWENGDIYPREGAKLLDHETRRNKLKNLNQLVEKEPIRTLLPPRKKATNML